MGRYVGVEWAATQDLYWGTLRGFGGVPYFQETIVDCLAVNTDRGCSLQNKVLDSLYGSLGMATGQLVKW